MKKTFKLNRYVNEWFTDGFYRESINLWTTKGTDRFYRKPMNGTTMPLSVCKDFVNYCGIGSYEIKLSISTVRPHQKGWKIVSVVGSNLRIGKEKKIFEGLCCHFRLFVENNTNVGWVKVEEIV